MPRFRLPKNFNRDKKYRLRKDKGQKVIKQDNDLVLAESELTEEELKQKKYNEMLDCERLAYRQYLYAFNTEILGTNINDESVHLELCQEIQQYEINKKLLVMYPRYHLKTTNAVIGYCLWRIINNCNVRILVLSATPDLAKDSLKAMQDHLRLNERFRELYGDYTQLAEKWNENKLVVSRTQILSGDTVYATGILGNIVGKHFDVIICDDLVNLDDVSSLAQRKKKSERFGALFDILKPGGQILVLGTRWCEEDLYGEIIKGNKKDDAGNPGQYEDFKIMIKKVEKEDGTPFYPGQFPPERIAELKRTRREFFYAQYMNDPQALKGKAFEEGCVEFYTNEDQIPKKLITFQAHDLSTGKHAHTDYYADVTIGFDDSNGIWLLDYDYEHVVLKDQPERVIDKAAIFIKSLCKCFIESNAYQSSLATYVLNSTKGKLLAKVIAEINHSDNKDQRIRGLGTVFNYNKLHIHQTKHELLYKQMLAYPLIEHDDLLDALETALINGMKEMLEMRQHMPNIRVLG